MASGNEFGECACFNLRRAARIITQAYDQALAPAGLKATQFTLLAVLAGNSEGIAISSLADKLGMDRTTLTRNLAVVERSGLVSVRPGDDPRVKLISLTSKGKATFVRAAPLWRQAQSKAIERLGGDWGQFLELTQRIAVA